MRKPINPQKLSKLHYEILVNGKRVKILGFSEKPSYLNGGNDDALLLTTKLKGQMFNNKYGSLNTIEIVKEGAHIKYSGIWKGTFRSGLQEQYIYCITGKAVSNK